MARRDFGHVEPPRETLRCRRQAACRAENASVARLAELAAGPTGLVGSQPAPGIEVWLLVLATARELLLHRFLDMLARAGLTSVRARSPRSADVWRPALSVGQARLSYAQRAFHASVLAGQIAAQAGAGAGNAAAPAPATPKPAPNQNQSARKFWKAVTLVRADPTVDKDGTSIPEHWQVRLDGRALRTPERKLLHVPLDRPLLASLLAREWDQLDTVLRPHSLPVVRLHLPLLGHTF